MDDAFGYWLSGFVDGEGCFSIARVTSRNGNPNNRTWPNCRLSIMLRADDLAVLRTIRDALGMGNITIRHGRTQDKRNENDSALLSIHRIDDCLRIVELFHRYPLRAKKAAQFRVWADGVHEVAKGIARSDKRVDEIRARLADLRKFVPPREVAKIVGDNPAPLRHRRDYGIAPACLCGCGATMKVITSSKSVAHPDNPNYCAFQRGHNLRVSHYRKQTSS